MIMLEIEEKYPLGSPAVFDAIRTAGHLGGYRFRRSETHDIGHEYLDTGSWALFSKGMCLRVREKAGILYVTFKLEVDQARVRREIEEHITPGDAILLLSGEIEQIPGAAARTAELHIGEGRLRPVLGVQNLREAWYFGDDESEVKVCFDRLQFDCLIDGASRSASAYELEIELQHGDATFLANIAKALVDDYGLRSESRSKYQRGVAMLGLVSIHTETPCPLHINTSYLPMCEVAGH